MTSEKLLTLSHDELIELEIHCPACGLGTVLNIRKQHALPDHCSGCMRCFSDSALAALTAYQRFQREAENSGVKFLLRIKEKAQPGT